MLIVLSFDELEQWINEGICFYKGRVYHNNESIPRVKFDEVEVPFQRPIVKVDDRYLSVLKDSNELDGTFPLVWNHVVQVGTWNEEGLEECWVRLREFHLVPEETWKSGLFRSFEGFVEKPPVSETLPETIEGYERAKGEAPPPLPEEGGITPPPPEGEAPPPSPEEGGIAPPPPEGEAPPPPPEGEVREERIHTTRKASKSRKGSEGKRSSEKKSRNKAGTQGKENIQMNLPLD